MSDAALPLAAHEAALVERAAAFTARVIAPSAARWEREGSAMPREIVREWSALGLNAIEVATEHGGQGAGYLAKLAVVEAVAGVCLPSAFSLVNMHGAVARLARDGTPDQVKRHLPGLLSGEVIGGVALTEPGAGSDFTAIATHARQVSGGWRLDGEKAWATNAAIADQILVYAQTASGSGAKGIAGFLVDMHAAGVERVPAYDLVGGAVIGAAGVRMTDHFVADADVLYPPGQGFKRAMVSINGARTYVAGMCCAMVEACLAIAVDYAGRRRSFGKALIEHQGLRWSLADVATELEAARLLTAKAARLVASRDDAMVAAAHAKKFAVRVALEGIAATMQAMGAAGLRAAYPFGRHLISARLAAYVDGTTEMQNERIGADLAKRFGGRAGKESEAKRSKE